MAKAKQAAASEKTFTVRYVPDTDSEPGKKVHKMRAEGDDNPRVGSRMVYVSKEEFKDAPSEVVAVYTVKK